MNAVEFIERISNELDIPIHTIKQQHSDGIFVFINENGLSCITRTDNNVFISYQDDDGLNGQLVQANEELLEMVINAYKTARIELAKFNEQRRILQIEDWGLGK